MEHLTARKAAEILNINVATLRAWEHRGLVQPIILPNGYRMYSKECIDALLASKPNLKKGWGQYDIVGKKFGKLTVLSRAPDRNTRQSWWLCRCDCGTVKEVKGLGLISGGSKSCGCSRSGRPAHNYRGCDDLSGKYWSRVKRGAKDRGLQVKITIQDAWEIYKSQDGKCALSGIPIVLNRQHRQTASLDRIDSTKGYVKDNVQWVHVDVQKMKNNLPESRLFDLCEQIYKTQNNL